MVAEGRETARRTAIVAVLCAVAASAASCARDDAPTTDARPEEPQFAWSETWGDDPARLTLRLDRTEADLAERVLLEQVLRVEPGFEAEFPEYLPEDFEGFSVVRIDYPDGPPPPPSADRRSSPSESSPDDGSRASEGARSWRKRLVLEPERSGELTIAPLAVYWREAGATAEELFLTEEVKLTVRALGDLESLRVSDPPGALPPPVDRGLDPRLVWSLAGVGLASLATLVAWLLTRAPPPPPPPPPPHEVAWESLRRLVAQSLVERGEVELFFVHLSAILRTYIEDRFDVHAPEQTTEEFLVEASRAEALRERRDRLREFLELSDRVKFALHRPLEADIQASFDVVKRFIDETTPSAGGAS